MVWNLRSADPISVNDSSLEQIGLLGRVKDRAVLTFAGRRDGGPVPDAVADIVDVQKQ